MRYEAWALVAAGVGCGMYMAVWAFGLDQDNVYVATKASTCLPPKHIVRYLESMLAQMETAQLLRFLHVLTSNMKSCMFAF